MNKPPTIRLHLYLAAEAKRGVILRQGPSKHYCMIGWDTKTNTFEPGQWVKHKVYTERCDISPDGRHFLYFMLDGRWDAPSRGSYTVISRVPYFTALALYPQGDTWGGGGFFVDNAQYSIKGNRDQKDIVGRAEGLSRDLGGPEPSLMADAVGRLRAILAGKAKTPKPDETPSVMEQVAALVERKEHYLTDGPLLYQRTAEGAVDLIGDFSDMRFTTVLAPYEGGTKE